MKTIVVVNIKKTSLSISVNCPVGLQFYISFTFIYTTHKSKKQKQMSKTKAFLTDSQLERSGVQGWRSGESTRLPPMWPGFDSETRRHMWVGFVDSLLCTERFSPGTPVSPLHKNQHLT